MEELVIYEFQRKEILETFRLIKNIYREGKEETSLDRSIANCEKHLAESLENKKQLAKNCKRCSRQYTLEDAKIRQNWCDCGAEL